MLLPCEQVVKELLPALRASTAVELSKKHHLSQNQIAKELGITQAAVSKYLSGSTQKKVKQLSHDPRIAHMAHELAADIAVKHIDRPQLISSICDCCTKFRNDEECDIRYVAPPSESIALKIKS